MKNAVLEFARVVKAQEQVVAGTLHHLTIEAIEAGKKKLYEAKVWVKPWMNFKDLQEFKHVGDSPPAFTSSDLGCKKGDSLLLTQFMQSFLLGNFSTNKLGNFQQSLHFLG